MKSPRLAPAHTIVGLFLLLAVLPFSGCVNSPSGTSIITPNRVYAITKLASYATATALLAQDGARLSDLQKASNGFCQLVNQRQWDLTTLAAIAQQNGLKILESKEGSLVLVGAPLLVDVILNKQLDLRSAEYAPEVVKGACDGLSLAVPTSLSPTGTRAVELSESGEMLKQLETEAAATR